MREDPSPAEGGRELSNLPVALTVGEAAKLLRIGKNGAYAAVADGSLPSIRIGRLIRIPRHALLQLLEAPVATEPRATGTGPARRSGVG